MSQTGKVLRRRLILPGEPGQQRASRRRYLRHVLWGGSGLRFCLIVGIVGCISGPALPTFENIIRKRLIARIEEATGGRAEIGSFHWNPLKLEAEADGLVLHGREAPGEAPYAQLDSLKVSVSILDLWSPRVLLRDLEIERPQIHLIVYPDGSTNQPQPRTRRRKRIRWTHYLISRPAMSRWITASSTTTIAR